MKKITFFILFPILIFSHCTSESDTISIGPFLFEKHYNYLTRNEIPNMYYNGVRDIFAEKGDLDVPEFAPYMINDTLFVLHTFPELGGMYISDSDVEDYDLASTNFRLYIFTKNKNEHLSYKIKKMILHTSDYVKDVEELGFKWYNSRARETDYIIHYYDEYRKAEIDGGYLLYPRPKDMKISIYLEVEINEDNTISSHSFVYHYNLKLGKVMFHFLS
ncbi:MAG: hypothetical protein LBK83_06230 [Treponema sp.]|nr:hypothetical protein [Treponema sp.]